MYVLPSSMAGFGCHIVMYTGVNDEHRRSIAGGLVHGALLHDVHELLVRDFTVLVAVKLINHCL